MQKKQVQLLQQKTILCKMCIRDSIGTERHESRRIDNQLRGRAGRQGDPGESRFYISLEDDLMRLFGSERLMSVFNALGVEDGEQIEHKMLSSAIEKAQEKIENNNFGIRKNLLEYDQVMNEQREIIYSCLLYTSSSGGIIWQYLQAQEWHWSHLFMKMEALIMTN